jgi:hypothetical protein
LHRPPSSKENIKHFWRLREIEPLCLRFGAPLLIADVYDDDLHAANYVGGFAAVCFGVTSLIHQ